MAGKIVTLAELVEILDVSPKAVRDLLISPSFPIHEKGHRGKPHLFDTAQVINWLRERERKRAAEKPNKDNDVRDRLAAIKIQKAELELRKAAGTLIDFRELGPFIQDKLIGFRQALCAIPAEMRERFGKEAGSFCDVLVTQTVNRLAAGMDGAEQHARDLKSK